MLCGMLVPTLFHDADDRLITGQSPSYDGVVLITRKMLKLQPIYIYIYEKFAYAYLT